MAVAEAQSTSSVSGWRVAEGAWGSYASIFSDLEMKLVSVTSVEQETTFDLNSFRNGDRYVFVLLNVHCVIWYFRNVCHT